MVYIMIIDAHVHLFSEKDEDAPLLLSAMKKNKIDKSCVMYWPFGDASNPDGKVMTLMELVKIVTPYPNLSVIGSMKVTDKKTYSKNLKEIEILLKQKKLVALKFYLGYEHYFANDAIVDPLYKLCVKYDVPAVFHTGDNWITPVTKNALIRYANPLFIDDVAVKYPSLKIVICHLGNPWVSEAALLISKHKNVYGEISGLLSYENPNDTFSKVDNEVIRQKVIELIAWCHTPRKLVFGTDFNIYPQKDYIDFVNSLPNLSKEDKEYIFYKNAQMLFKI